MAWKSRQYEHTYCQTVLHSSTVGTELFSVCQGPQLSFGSQRARWKTMACVHLVIRRTKLALLGAEGRWGEKIIWRQIGDFRALRQFRFWWQVGFGQGTGIEPRMRSKYIFRSSHSLFTFSYFFIFLDSAEDLYFLFHSLRKIINKLSMKCVG